MEWVPSLFGLIVQGSQTNWWSVGCPAHCFGSGIPSFALAFGFGLTSGIILGDHPRCLCLPVDSWIFGVSTAPVLLPCLQQATIQQSPGLLGCQGPSPGEHYEINLAVQFQGLRITVSGPSARALDFVHKLSPDHRTASTRIG